MRKKSFVWAAMFAAWAPCAALVWIGAGFLIASAAASGGRQGALAVCALCAGAAALSAVWLVPARRFAFAAAMRLHRGALPAPSVRAEPPRVLLVWDASGGFDPVALSLSRRQEGAALRTVILDDGKDAARRRAVQNFAIRHNNVEVFCAPRGGEGLNALLRGREDYDLCAIAGEDVMLPADFVRRALDYFAEGACGCVQARIDEAGDGLAARVRGVASAVAAAEHTVRERCGAGGLSGQGVLLSRGCIEGTGGFPPVPDPLPAFAAEAKDAGFVLRFAPDIACVRAPRSLPALRAADRRRAASARAYARFAAQAGARVRLSGAERADRFSAFAERAAGPLTLLLSLCAAALGAAGFFALPALLLVLLTGALCFASAAAEAFAAEGRDRQAALLYALARFAFDFSGTLALPRDPSPRAAGVRAGVSVAAGVLALLFAGFLCGGAWPMLCTALGCFLAPAAVALPALFRAGAPAVRS